VRSRRLALAALLGLIVAVGLLQFTYHHLGEVVSGDDPRPAMAPFVEEMSSALAVGGLFLAIRWLTLVRPLTPQTWLRRLPLYAAAMLAFTIVHTFLNWGLRALIFPLVGLGAYDYGEMPLRFAMEAPADVLAFSLCVAGLHAWARLRQARERELEVARLEASVAQAQLHNLRLQLQPHFLFNTLHAVSATMYDDPAAADEVLASLAELLRASLRGTAGDELPLGDELALLERYLGIMRARFGERLAVTIDAEPAALPGLVPFMCIQPLVENAVRHGNAAKTGRGTVVVRARLERGQLVVEVEDDGPGVPAGRDALSAGFGLSSTAERLRLLYRGGAEIAAGNLPGGGFRVTARLPFREAG
jgi:two-component system, LytTR family, sensor kinase